MKPFWTPITRQSVGATGCACLATGHRKLPIAVEFCGSVSLIVFFVVADRSDGSVRSVS
jgi:hypothetical protein